jgi:iron complex transport system permease protein
LAVAAGVALSVSGVAYQGCFRNPLIEPYILGVSSGAACGAALAIVFPRYFPQTQTTAFAFALLAVFLSHGLARNKGLISPVALVISGIIVGALFSAVVGIMKYLAAETQLREITFWMMGGLYYATWDDAQLSLAVVTPVFLLLWYYGWRMNILSLGDEEARSLGLNPSLCRFVIVLASTLAASVCVSICGIIAWVGLMAPHAARLVLGPDNRWVVPGAAALGAIYLLVCDTIARTLVSAEIPLGIITSILGAPYLLWLLRSKGKDIYGQ